MYGKFSSRFFFLLLLAACLFLVFNRHSRSRFSDYHSINWADAGGYYSYLPALFIYEFDAAQFPDSIDHRSGDGFYLDHETGKVKTKYNYGVALLQAPFFLAAHASAGLAGYNSDGYNPWYYRFIMCAGVFYLLAGLYFIRKVLHSKGVGIVLSDVIVIILLGATNLYYYGINSPGFSHVYSFFLFSVFIFLTNKYVEKKKYSTLVILSLVYAAALLVRLTNGIIILYFLSYSVSSIASLKARITIKNGLTFLSSAIIIFIPQLLYWKYASGELMSDMYGKNEYFNFTDPHIKEILFSPYNGLFPYTPIVIIFIAAALFKSLKKDSEAIGILIMTCIAVYVFSSWYSWTYGCSYGSRPFCEYMAFLILPFALWMSNSSKPVRNTILTLSLLLVIFNINTLYHYDGCWYGGVWDWEEYKRIILR